MSRPVIQQPGGRWPRVPLVDDDVQDEVIVNLNEHATALDTASVKSKYLLAGYNRVHMAADSEGLDALVALTGGATQAQANARAEALRAAMLAHMDGVGTTSADGEHLASDPINRATLAAVPALTSGSNATACATLVVALNAALNKHATQPGVHFHDGVSTIGTPQFPLCHCSVEVTATCDGVGGVVYSSNVVNVSGGVSVGNLTFPDPSYLVVPLTLPIAVAASARVILHSLRIVTSPLLGAGPFGLFILEVGSSGTDVSLAIPTTGTLPGSPTVITLGVTFVMSVASTPLFQMPIAAPVTLADLIADLNDLLTQYLSHFLDHGSE